jgi:hypothetical protein
MHKYSFSTFHILGATGATGASTLSSREKDSLAAPKSASLGNAKGKVVFLLHFTRFFVTL